MSRTKPVIVNAAHDESLLQVFPKLPVLSSQIVSWSGIQLAHHQHLAALETPEQCRVEQAKQLLKTNLAIATVATQVRFVDQSHPTGYFKRQVGVSPNQFRA